VCVCVCVCVCVRVCVHLRYGCLCLETHLSTPAAVDRLRAP